MPFHAPHGCNADMQSAAVCRQFGSLFNPEQARTSFELISGPDLAVRVVRVQAAVSEKAVICVGWVEIREPDAVCHRRVWRRSGSLIHDRYAKPFLRHREPRTGRLEGEGGGGRTDEEGPGSHEDDERREAHAFR